VLEPEAARGVRVVDELIGGALLLLFLVAVPVEWLVVLGKVLVALDLLLARGELLHLGATVPIPVPVLALHLGGERDQRAREGVDLVGGERGAVRQVGLVLGQQPLQAEQQRELASPCDRGHLAALVDLDERGLERPAAGASFAERLCGVLALEQEWLTRELFSAFEIGVGNGRVGEDRSAISHSGFDLRVVESGAVCFVKPPQGQGGDQFGGIAARVGLDSRSAPSQQRGVYGY
jgi:hypothetical protein